MMPSIIRLRNDIDNDLIMLNTWVNLESQEHYFVTQRLARKELPPMIKGILGNTQKDRQRSRLLCMVIYERITLRTDGERKKASCWHPKQLKGSGV